MDGCLSLTLWDLGPVHGTLSVSQTFINRIRVLHSGNAHAGRTKKPWKVKDLPGLNSDIIPAPEALVEQQRFWRWFGAEFGAHHATHVIEMMHRVRDVPLARVRAH